MKKLKGLDFLEIIRETGDEVHCICPFHADKKASLSVNPDKKEWHCFACNMGGNLDELNLTYYAILYHNKLLKDAEQLKLLYKKHLTIEDIKEYKIGYNKDNYRFSIPYIRKDSIVYGIKYHLLDPKMRKDPKNSKVAMEGKVPDFFPKWNFDNNSDHTYVTEGEFDCINLRKIKGRNVGTFGPVNYFDRKSIKYFKDKTVTIVYDNDKPGLKGADNLTVKLQDIAKEIRRVILIDQSGKPIKDICDYLDKYKPEKLTDVIDSAPVYKIEKDTRVIDIRADFKDEKKDEVSFQDSVKSEFYGKLVTVRGLVSGKDTSPFLIPTEVAMYCSLAKKSKSCAACPLKDDTVKLRISTLSRSMLQMMLSADSQQRHILRTLINAPRCPEIEIKNINMINVEDIRIIPKSPEDRHFGYSTRQVFRVCNDLVETNTPYIFKGLIIPEPRLQYAVILSDQSEKDKQDIDLFDITTSEINQLKKYIAMSGGFKGLTKTVEGITGIYYRELMSGVILLSHASVLEFDMFGKTRRGYMSSLILGDTRTGKTEAINGFTKAIGLGEVISGKITSRAGIIGGCKKINGRYIINWGKIVINNGGILKIDESSGMTHDDFSKLTNIRSSGEAEIVMTETEKAIAKTRLMIIANPRAARMMKDFSYGVLAIQDLIGKAEDISRFDLYVGVNIDDIDKKQLMEAQEKGPKFSKKDIEMFRKLILFTWTRKPDQIKINKPTIEKLKEEAMTFDYSPDIPLFERNSGIYKLARISISMSVCNGNFDTNGNINVKPSDVKMAGDFLKELFDSRGINYGEYSMTVGRRGLKDENAITEKCKFFGEDFIEGLLSTSQLTLRDIEDFSGLTELSEAKELASYLVRKRALSKKYNFYEKSQEFIRLLRSLLYKLKGGKR